AIPTEALALTSALPTIPPSRHSYVLLRQAFRASLRRYLLHPLNRERSQPVSSPAVGVSGLSLCHRPPGKRLGLPLVCRCCPIGSVGLSRRIGDTSRLCPAADAGSDGLFCVGMLLSDALGRCLDGVCS